MTQLNQIIAIETGVKERTQRAITDSYHAIQKTQLLTGLTRVYTPKDDEGDRLPSERQNVQINAADLVRHFQASLTRLFDVTFTKDRTNTLAKASVEVDGVTLVEDAPVPYLLFLEKQLVNVRTFILTLPTLDPAEQWELDPSQGVYRSTPVETTRNVKVPQVLVKYEATKEHPAQTEVYNHDEMAGTWTTTKFSGALPPTEVAGMVARVDAVIEAVKQAREAANTTAVMDAQAGDAVLGYIFGG